MSTQQINCDTEEIEGLGGDEDATWGDYPIDTLLIRNENRTVHDVLRRIEKGSFVMVPDFQRDFIWPGQTEQTHRIRPAANSTASFLPRGG